MLQHLQLIKPKKVYKIYSYLEKLQKKNKKTRYNKNITSLSYQLKGALHLYLFLHHL